MKSAYELAMDRLAQQSPTVKLTAAKKRELAELDARYKAKIAEREIFLKGETEKAIQKGDYEALAQLERQMQMERRALEAECEEKKEAARSAK